MMRVRVPFQQLLPILLQKHSQARARSGHLVVVGQRSAASCRAGQGLQRGLVQVGQGLMVVRLMHLPQRRGSKDPRAKALMEQQGPPLSLSPSQQLMQQDQLLVQLGLGLRPRHLYVRHRQQQSVR